MREVVIGDHVLTAPNVHITDRNHEFRDVSIPIIKQGYFSKGPVVIESGCWIGTNAVIIGPVHIGKNCVVGANAVVTKDIPDYSIAVGNPAKVIKIYDQSNADWKKV